MEQDSERVRTTISVNAEVLEVFKRMADVAGASVSRCMGDWLADTVDAAQLATSKLVEVRRSPERVVTDYMRHMAEETVRLMQNRPSAIDVRELGRLQKATMDEMNGGEGRPPAGGPAGAPPAPRSPSPPSSNTGGKVPRGNTKKARR